MTTRTIHVRRATPDDIPALTPTLVAAFLHAPDAQWLIPDLNERRRVYQQLCPAFLTHVMTTGAVHTTTEHTGAALWLPHTTTHTADPRHTARIERITDRHSDRFATLAELLQAHAPRRPHLYLAHLGVTPARQRHGIGTALLTYRHATCDTAGTPIHLVATSRAARDFYQRLGYHPTTTTTLYLPDGGPPIWPMWRQPRTSPQGRQQ
ncbi:GNAT family N-acetyltransferase [Solwaraspora sp. WMMB335]|uniref:GNAT family N-acetyltransferase n=1 Tax=Solwaraspora sp. WMMB335 TaxID=3404118 RepID=UPI003B94D9D1